MDDSDRKAGTWFRLCTAHIAEHGLAVPIDGDTDLDPATAVAVLTEVARATIPKLGNRTYPHWPVTAYHVTHDLKELTRQHTGVRLPEVAASTSKRAATPARASAAKVTAVAAAPLRAPKVQSAPSSLRDRVAALAAERREQHAA